MRTPALAEGAARLRRPGVALSLLGLGSAALGLGGTSWLFLVVATGWVVPAATLASATVVGLPVLAGAACLVLTGTAVAERSISGTTLAGVLLVVVLALNAATPRARRLGNLDDLLAGTASLAVFAVFGAPYVGADTGRRLALLSFTTDAGNHLQLIRAVMRHGGFLSLLPGLQGELYGGMEDYPPGLSGVVGLVLQAHLGSEPTVAAFVGSVSLALVGLYAVMGWLATSLALVVLRRLRPDAGLLPRALTTAASAGFLLFGYDTQLLRDACYAQILATAAVLAFSLVLQADVVRYAPAALALLCLTLMDSWYVLAPVLACLALLHLWLHPGSRRAALAWYAAIAPACAFPVLTGPGAKHLNVPGFLFFPRSAGVLALALTLGAALGYVVLHGGRPRRTRLLLPALAAGLLSCTVAIGAYQAVTDGAAGYYALKALYSTFVLAGCTTALAVGLVSADRARPTTPPGGRRAALLALPALVLAVPLASLSEPLLRGYVRGLPVTPDQPAALAAPFKDHPLGVGGHDDAWIVDACGPLRDFVLSKWVYDLSLGWSVRREELLMQIRKIKDGRPYRALAAMAADPTVASVTVYVHHPCQQDDLRLLEQVPKVRVVRVP